ESGNVAFPPTPKPPPLLMGLPPEPTTPPAPSPPVPSPPAPAPPPESAGESVGERRVASFGAEQAVSAKMTRAAGYMTKQDKTALMFRRSLREALIGRYRDPPENRQAPTSGRPVSRHLGSRARARARARGRARG